MTGHICLVTGSTHGIGLATAMGLARVGATVVVHGRNAARVETVVETIRGEPGNRAASTSMTPASERFQSLATANRLFTATTKTAPPRKSTRFAMIRVSTSPM